MKSLESVSEAGIADQRQLHLHVAVVRQRRVEHYHHDVQQLILAFALSVGS